MNPQPDHYATLNVRRDATDAEIKRGYRKLMRSVHPDANTNDPDATRKAAALNAAFETLGDPAKRRAYDDACGRRGRGRYEVWAEQPDWEDIVAEQAVAPRQPRHVHSQEPAIEPGEIEVDMAELRQQPRVRRTVRVTNHCDCTLLGDVSTSEPWVWGPVGQIRVGPNTSVAFDIEVIASKVAFPGISRAIFVTKDWSGVVPVKITGYEPRRRRVPSPASDMAYAPVRRRKWARR